MKDHRRKKSATAAGVTRETLERTPARALQFLMGVSARPAVRAVLEARGYTRAEHRRGWSLLERVGSHQRGATMVDELVVAALEDLASWLSVNLRLVNAGLTRHPEARDTVMKDLAPAEGPDAVLVASALLERLDALEGTPEGDAALATLAARGVDATARREAAALVRTAKSDGSAAHPELLTEDGEFEQDLVELYLWLSEWSEVTRLFVKRRDHLITLGLAERRSGDADPSATEDPSAASAEPTSSATALREEDAEPAPSAKSARSKGSRGSAAVTESPFGAPTEEPAR